MAHLRHVLWFWNVWILTGPSNRTIALGRCHEAYRRSVGWIRPPTVMIHHFGVDGYLRTVSRLFGEISASSVASSSCLRLLRRNLHLKAAWYCMGCPYRTYVYFTAVVDTAGASFSPIALSWALDNAYLLGRNYTESVDSQAPGCRWQIAW